MNIVHKILSLIQGRLELAQEARPSHYNDGYIAALQDVDEDIQDLAWEEGELDD